MRRATGFPGSTSIATAGLGAAMLLGCTVGGVPRTELPEDPIAFSYRTPEEARRRADSYHEEQERRRPSKGRTQARPKRGGSNDFVADEDAMTALLAMVLGPEASEQEQYPGRLALYHPREGKLEVIGAARRGSVPQAWSRDRQRLLFSQPMKQGLQIFEYSRADRTVRAVTHPPLVHTQACYGLDGRIVVAAVDTRHDPMRSRIAVSEPGGRAPLTNLTSGPTDYSPACHPGGGVAFVRESAPTRTQILFLDRVEDAPTPRPLTPGQHPAFSPDGQWLAFAAPARRELRLWRMRPDGSGRAPIGRGMRHEARPAVSPDGRLVAYVAGETRPRRHLYVRRFDGSGDRILFADGDGEYPVW